jgi:hypothetical protein
MPRTRIYECLPNAVTGKTEIKLTDEDGNLINKSCFESLEKAVIYFREVRDELALNKHLVITETNKYRFEYRKVC